MLINEIQGKQAAGINSATWRMTQRRERDEASKKRIQALIKRYREYGYRYPGDPDYVEIPAGEGEYTVVLVVGAKKYVRQTAVLKDHWYDQR
jgi:hypothetical protein